MNNSYRATHHITVNYLPRSSSSSSLRQGETYGISCLNYCVLTDVIEGLEQMIILDGSVLTRFRYLQLVCMLRLCMCRLLPYCVCFAYSWRVEECGICQNKHVKLYVLYYYSSIKYSDVTVKCLNSLPHLPNLTQLLEGVKEFITYT